jgi:6-phosphofructo-2-kinase/fructose-2,6-biphosphatase 2
LQRLPGFFAEQGVDVKDLRVYTSPLPRAIQTAEYLSGRTQQWSCLNMLDTGICHGMSVAQIQREMPDEYAKFLKEPFTYRWVRVSVVSGPACHGGEAPLAQGV